MAGRSNWGPRRSLQAPLEFPHRRRGHMELCYGCPNREALGGRSVISPVRRVMEKLRVYFTIDTETSMGGAWRSGAGPMPLSKPVWGEHGSERYGITLIMDALEEHGFKGTFFVEVFCAYLAGASERQRAFGCIPGRGHDVQLHLHPVQRFYYDFVRGAPRREEDFMFRFPAEEQRELIAEGAHLFQQLSGTKPRAYRAGCYAASEVT